MSVTAETSRSPAADCGKLDQLCINTIRTLSMDAVQAANSGHPGTPMALAPVAYCLWQHFLRFDPDDPIWPNRDRFVLSNGHASMLLYSHAAPDAASRRSDRKYETLGELSVKLDDIKHFRQLDSKCPGHPEYRWTSGVETTTGPLGQGVGQQRRHGDRRQAGRPHTSTGPASSLFNLQRLRHLRRRRHDGGRFGTRPPRWPATSSSSNLCWIYDNNHITIEGNTDLAFSEDVATRFLGYGWNVTRVGDANDLERLATGLPDLPEDARDRPTLIIVDSHIAYGAPEQAGHQRRPRRTAGRGGNPPDQAALRLAGGRQVPGARRRLPSISSDGLGKRGKELREAWFARARRLQEEVSGAGRPASPMQHRAAAGRLGQGPADLPGRRQGHGHARFVRQGAQRRRQERALADRRRRGPGPLHQDAHDLRRRRRFRAEQATAAATSISASANTPWPSDPQRPVAEQGAALRLELPDLQRLCPAADPPQRPHGSCRSSTSSRTIPSAWARTARRTSRSSTWLRCGPSRA